MPRILAIDDSPSALEIIEQMLAGSGYQVRTCTDGKRALQMLKHEPFDLILTDIYMPGDDGLEVIRESRQLWQGMPIVAMSGITGQRCMLPVAKLMGACQLLRKPFSRADLLAAVGAALGTAPTAQSPSSRDIPVTGPVEAPARPATLRERETPPYPDKGFRE